jgi:hypothetical protein
VKNKNYFQTEQKIPSTEGTSQMNFMRSYRFLSHYQYELILKNNQSDFLWKPRIQTTFGLTYSIPNSV